MNETPPSSDRENSSGEDMNYELTHQSTKIKSRMEKNYEYYEKSDTNEDKPLWSIFGLESKRNFGKCFPFFFYKGEPLCIIGPDCKIDKFK